MTDEAQATTETQDAPAETTGAAAGLAQTSAPDWAGAFSDENREWVAKKGLADAESAVNSYRQLEKLFGADKAGRTVTLPENGDATAWNEIYDKMGRPESAADYGLGDDPFASAMADAFHKAGLSTDRAGAIKEAADTFIASQEAARADEWNKQSEREHDEWRQELGSAGYDKAVKAYRAATVEFDLDPGKIQKLEEAIGTKETLKFISMIGAKIGEDTMPDPAKIQIAHQEASAKIEALKADKHFRQRFANGDADAVELWERLHEQAHAADPKAYARQNFQGIVPGV